MKFFQPYAPVTHWGPVRIKTNGPAFTKFTPTSYQLQFESYLNTRRPLHSPRVPPSTASISSSVLQCSQTPACKRGAIISVLHLGLTRPITPEYEGTNTPVPASYLKTLRLVRQFILLHGPFLTLTPLFASVASGVPRSALPTQPFPTIHSASCHAEQNEIPLDPFYSRYYGECLQ